MNGKSKQQFNEGIAAGWLALVGIGVFLAPVAILYNTGVNIYSILPEGVWEALTHPLSKAYVSGFESVFYIQTIINAFLFIASIYLITLYWTASRKFTRWYIGFTIASCLAIFLDYVFYLEMFPKVAANDPNAGKGLIGSCISGVVWILYMLRSRRVKATFVN